MTKEKALEYVFDDHDPELYRMFGIDKDEFDQRAQRGIESALFRQMILNEWAACAPGEMELSNRRHSRLKEVSETIRYMKGVAAFFSVSGSYLLENKVPPCIK